MPKRPREAVIEDIIELGKRLEWFKNTLKDLTLNSYIFPNQSYSNKIEIDTSILLLFSNKTFDEGEVLWEHLMEIINKVVTDAKEYEIIQHIPF